MTIFHKKSENLAGVADAAAARVNLGIPQAAALTAPDGGTVDGTYGAEEAAVLANVVVRQGEIEAALVAAGILTAGS